MRIIIVRHGDPDYEHDCLTDLGKIQAEAAAKRLMGEGIETIYSSSMGRAVETAKPFAELSGIGPIHQLDFMREIRYGFEGALHSTGNPWIETDKMSAEDKEILDPNWREIPFFKENIATVDVDMIAEEADKWMLELGYQREGEYYRNVREDNQEHTVVLFCHGGSGTALLAHLLNLPFPYLCAIIRMEHTAITTLRFNSEPGSKIMPVLELASDSRHIHSI